jgi:hypothetical protein
VTLHTQTRPTTDLTPHPHNPRNGDTDAIRDSLRAHGQYRAIVTTRDGTILAGNHTYAAAVELGWDQIECHVLDLDPYGPEAHRIMLADNRTSDLGTYDEGLLLDLLKDMSPEDLDGTGYTPKDVDDLRGLTDEDDDTDWYTKIANLPQYQPTLEHPPPVGALVDLSKAEALAQEVRDAMLPDDTLTAYLIYAAYRHARFDYRAAAEFYAHAPAEVQHLMERSALVIVDPMNAIRDGFLRLDSSLDEILEADEDGA